MGEVIDFRAGKLKADLDLLKASERRAQSILLSRDATPQVRAIAERELPVIREAIVAALKQLVSLQAIAAPGLGSA